MWNMLTLYCLNNYLDKIGLYTLKKLNNKGDI